MRHLPKWSSLRRLVGGVATGANTQVSSAFGLDGSEMSAAYLAPSPAPRPIYDVSLPEIDVAWGPPVSLDEFTWTQVVHYERSAGAGDHTANESAES